MILAIDVGNTHIVLGCLEGDRILSVARMTSDVHKTEHEYAVSIRDILAFRGVDVAALEGAILSSVVWPLNDTLVHAVELLTGRPPLMVGRGLKTGLDIRIDDPGQVGADLVVGAVAALAIAPPPLIVIDMGTATTIMVDNDKGEFIGGVIVPGVGISLNALGTNASKLPKINLTAPAKVINGQTVEAMQSGTVYGQAGLLDGIIRRMTKELGYPCKVVATGGLAKLIVPYCETPIVLDNDLMLKGLRLIYEKNKSE